MFPVDIESQTNLKSVIVKLQQLQQSFTVPVFQLFRRLADASLGGPVCESNYKHHHTNREN